MAKEISMPQEEYVNDVKMAKVAGMDLVVKIVRDIFATGGANISTTNNVDPEFLKFMDELKTIKGKLDGQASTSNP